MASIIRTLSDKENSHGEVTDAEDVFDITEPTNQNPTSSFPVVVGERSSDVVATILDTTTQHFCPQQQQQHRTVSGLSNVDHVEEDEVVIANVVIADEEIPFIEDSQRQRMVENEVVVEDEDDEEDDYEYEDDDYAAFSGFLLNNDPAIVVTVPTKTAENFISNDGSESKPATIEEEVITTTSTSEQQPSISPTIHKPKWRQPSEEAVNMSIRAGKETTGNKRRLALDLYRIMNQETDQAGFTLLPKSDDCMNSWIIKLFQFDEDSKLAQDMKVLNVPFVELEMNFPDQYPFEPPFVRVTQPRFRRQTGFVMNGALCMELLTKVSLSGIFSICSFLNRRKPHSIFAIANCVLFQILKGWLESN
jgi:ubiquitin-protein ligase